MVHLFTSLVVEEIPLVNYTVTVDSNGNVLVVEMTNSRVSVFETRTANSYAALGLLVEVTINSLSPLGVAISHNGNFHKEQKDQCTLIILCYSVYLQLLLYMYLVTCIT